MIIMDINLKRAFIPLIVVLFLSSVLFLIRGIAFGILQKWAKKTATNIDEIIIGSFRLPSIYWCIAIGLYVGIAVSEIPDKYIFYISKAILILVILSITLATASLSGKIFKNYIRKSELPIPTTGLAYGILKGAILAIGIMVVMSFLDISIVPIITALGVGGLAVALALQDSLANLFAGIHILVEKSIRVGDFVRLESGHEGYVEDITWRTTRIRMLPNNMVVIPNSKLSQSVFTNYYLPEKKMSVSIPVPVGYNSDIERVERIITEETAKSVGEVPGLLGDPKPDVKLVPGFGDNSLSFTLTFNIKEFTDQYTVQHELRKRIFKRFREENVEIPLPQRTVFLRKDL